MDVQSRAVEIARSLRALGSRHEIGDWSELLVWVVKGQLACAHRPLRYHRVYGGSGAPLPPEASHLLMEWAELAKVEGIRSIICLLHQKELDYYTTLDLGASDLLAFYGQQGFEVWALAMGRSGTQQDASRAGKRETASDTGARPAGL